MPMKLNMAANMKTACRLDYSCTELMPGKTALTGVVVKRRIIGIDIRGRVTQMRPKTNISSSASRHFLFEDGVSHRGDFIVHRVAQAQPTLLD